MDLFELSSNVSCMARNLSQMKLELKNILYDKFVNLPYKVEKISVPYKGDDPDQDDFMDVYYPVLKKPEGFTKENECFYRIGGTITHKYTLINQQGKKVRIREESTPDDQLVFETGSIYLGFNFVKVNSIHISVNCYSTDCLSKISSIDVISEVLKDKDIAQFYISQHYDNYKIQEAKYERYLKGLGRTKKLFELSELVKSDIVEFQISDTISAAVEISKSQPKSNPSLCYTNELYYVKFYKKPSHLTEIQIKPYFTSSNTVTINLPKMTFYYIEEELQSDKTFCELLGMLES